MPKFTTEIELDVDVLQVPKEAVASAMDSELNRFQAWFIQQGNDNLMRLERAILKTYLAWKLLYEHPPKSPNADG